MPIEQGQSIGRTDKDKHPEPLTDANIGGLLAGLNKEHSAILLIRMRPGQINIRGHLDTLLHQDGPRLWSNNSAFDLCQGSLSDISLVTKQVTDTQRGTVYGFEITDKGVDLGVPLAGHLLSFSEKHPELSLRMLLGTAISSSKKRLTAEGETTRNRAPLNRFRILEEIATSELPIRQIDLASSLVHDYPLDYKRIAQITAPLTVHLRSLKKAGIITYTSIEADKDYVFYSPASERPQEDVPVEKRQRTLTNDIEAVAYEAGNLFSSEDVLHQLIEKDSRYGTQNHHILKIQISEILALLSRHGFVDRVEGFSSNARSIINLTADQRDTATEFLNIIEKFRSQDPDSLVEGKRKAYEIASDAARSRRLQEKAYITSSNTQLVDPTVTYERIFSFLAMHPGSSNAEIQQYLEDEFEQRAEVVRFTKALERKGMLISEKVKHTKHYTLAEQVAPAKDTIIFDVHHSLKS